ncbi:cupin domain-containing protein [Cloacibacillus porcorum]|uniref:Cupin n=1 Tax=Cloacibacillus porcorum TaxID=1197717 RepID=A0A1B2I1I0_9BACT|nr:cupin domain-containing protein [Cloacibacillus porcorum]ANZ43823.1 cupin [Cloacibacillus porcorum]MDD7649635.1 cupin domain-containing protein [Cloacibacillus porcorum]MDY4092515.1 cupin domain-containing protein [Cloacibacillus porcorum]
MALIRQDEKPEITANLRGGSGEARIFASPLISSCGPLTFASRIELAPGASIGLHRHEDDEEVYAVVSGEGLYIYDGGECPAHAGDIFTTKKGMSHALKNCGGVPLIFFAVVAK